MKKGVTAVELMIAMIIFAIMATALWQVFSASRRGAFEIIENHSINEEIDRVLLKIMDDVRESNYIYENCPEAVDPSAIDSLQTKRENYLMFMKMLYDFSRDPSDLPDGQVNYTQNKVEYYVDRETPDSDWVLFRRMVPYDNNRQPVESEQTLFEILRGVKECVFYRLRDPDSSRTGNVYIRLKLARNTGDGKGISSYKNEITISVKERGASAE